MNAFATEDLDWRRPDVSAIVQHRGLLSTTSAMQDELCAWLTRHGYELIPVECGQGFPAVLEQFNELFSWQAQFGYRMNVDRANLDALRDGFGFGASAEKGVVMLLRGVDALYACEPRWTLGMLSIASEHSHFHLATGRRFFALLVVDERSSLIGATVDQISVPPVSATPSLPRASEARSQVDGYERELVALDRDLPELLRSNLKDDVSLPAGAAALAPTDPLRELHELVDGWCQRRELPPLSRVLPSLLGFQGLTDSWGELREAVRAAQLSALGEDEVARLRNIERAIDKMLRSR